MMVAARLATQVLVLRGGPIIIRLDCAYIYIYLCMYVVQLFCWVWVLSQFRMAGVECS